ncbi:MAG: hypothetical protein ACQETP_05190 [Bacteroidota bacterium]
MTKQSHNEAPTSQKEVPDTLYRRAFSADSDERCAVAAYPKAPIDLLRKLSEDDDPSVRKAVASNPNMPLELLWELAEEFPEAVVENPALSLQVAADPGAITEAPTEALIVLVGREQVSERWLRRGSDHYSYRVRKAAAKNPSAPTDVLKKLAQDSDDDVRKAVGGNPSSGMQVLGRLAEDTYYPNVRAAVAGNPSTPPQVLEHLAGDEHASVRKAVATNPAASTEALEQLIGDEYRTVRQAAAEHPSVPEEVFQLLRRAGADEKMRTVGCAPESLTEEERDRLFAWGRYGRHLLATHPDTPPATLERLASDADKTVRKAVAKHPATPLEALHTLASDATWQVRAAVAENPSTPTEVLDTLISDNDPFVHQAARRRLNP